MYSMDNELQLFMSLPVKHSFTKCYLLIDKMAIQDLILDDKGENIGHKHKELYTVVSKLKNEDPKSVEVHSFSSRWQICQCAVE
jgi:hypothetical protein